MMLAQFVNTCFEVLFWIIILTIFLSWIPNVDWNNNILKTFKTITETVLAPFRNIIPPINGLDLSPILALIILQLIQVAVVRILATLHL